MSRSVNVTLEGHAVIVNFACVREREDLISARVCEHRIRPLHKFMQPTHITDKFIAGAQIKMISIAQHKRRFDLFEMFRRKSFDGSLRANRRENGGDQLTVRCREYACACVIIFGSD